MKNFMKILGVVLLIIGSVLAAFTKVPAAEYTGIAIAALGLATSIVAVWKSSEEKSWKEIVAIVCFAVGGLLCGFSQMTEQVITQLITTIVGVVLLVVGIITSIIKMNKEPDKA